ncbi:MAG: imidazolonepropionase [Haloplasmataceae bacterium]|jgi:imidazolonepropionase|nr:imidazolonepropionase [Haloplasmataceae bacterium]
MDLIIYNISQLVTMRGKNALRCGIEMQKVEILENAYIVIKNGKFLSIGMGEGYSQYLNDDTNLLNGKGYLVTPGLIDSHTHLVHYGSREHELEMKLNGFSYMDILNKGGGILYTVAQTRAASFDQLYLKAKKSLDEMLRLGITCVEAKSGYGLNLETEIKQLEVAKKLNEYHPIMIKSTFLGAHAIPFEYKEKKDLYIEEVLKMLEVIKEKDLAEYCDVFCQDGIFDREESKRILIRAKELGFKLKIHADEMSSGGSHLACELTCVSADHLMTSTLNDIKNLANHKVITNLLPATTFNLNKDYALARLMIDNNCGVALSSDYNPGSCPSLNLQFVMYLATNKMKMLPIEVMTAVTMNGACSINLENEKGSIDIGKDADFVIFDAPNLNYIMYHFGINHVKDVYIKGKCVVSDQKICY